MSEISRGADPRLWTNSAELFRHSYRIASTDESPVAIDSNRPQPISGTSLRILMMRSVQLSSESGSRRCAAAFTWS